MEAVRRGLRRTRRRDSDARGDLASEAGSAVAPDDVPAKTDLERVEDIVADVVAIAESDAFEASSERILADIRE